ncbi:M23 family metallopeptidase [Georgenia yuyongxinii]|uniref:M23 family metallopeptidase n=1 Tax=Georgenia yuyongxinii TaxID=2589797 RepID=A0A552WJ77_9MICO|nr:M23 family metallopeptidase [Georgenia yuyongxinii]TRW42821.1 M23 family metallopeptidase [Georgenia yuyongxinii]
MSSRTQPQSAPLTRREIREARRAHEPKLRSLQAFASQLVRKPADADTGDDAQTVVFSTAGQPRRRDLRVAEGATAVHSRLTPRSTMLGVLGALALVAPITGVAQYVDHAAAATVGTEKNVLAPLDANAVAVATPETLTEDPVAIARAEAAAAASRAAEREALEKAEAEAAAKKAAEEKAAAEKAAAEAARQVVVPLPAGTFRNTSGYGGRNDPLGRGAAYSYHLGTDFAAPRNTPIHAAAAGTVVHAGAGKDGRSSNLVVIEHNIGGETFYTWYVHMYNDGVYVSAGQKVAAGEVIGGVGSNGNSTGNHLHFEVHLADDSTIEPLAWLQQHGAKDVSQL